MPIVVKKPKKYRPIQTSYDDFLLKNRQLKTTIEDTERRSLESLTTVSLLMLRRWWHRTSIRLGLKQVRKIDRFPLDEEEPPAHKSAWSDSLKKMEERVRAGDKIQSTAAPICSAKVTIGGETGKTAEHVEALRISQDLNAKCESLYAEYRQKIRQRRETEGKDVRELDSQIDAILDLYQSRKATYEKTIKELDALERGD
jgi:hypothetical protein